MAENKPPSDLEHAPHAKGGHEPDSVNARALTKFGIALALGLVATLFLVFFVFDALRGPEALKAPLPSLRVDVDVKSLPPEPRLQFAPVQDLQQMRAAEDRILNEYAWVDPDHGVVRIPISRAMDLLAQEGLPVRADAPRAVETVTLPTESGLGPVMTQAGGPLSPNRVFPPDQALEIHGTGSPRDGRQAGGPPTPPERSLANEPPAQGQSK